MPRRTPPAAGVGRQPARGTSGRAEALDLTAPRSPPGRESSADHGTSATPASTPPCPPPPKRSRYIPHAVWRAVGARDHGCCAWPLENGGVCGSTDRVQLDHIDGWALGAKTTVERSRLLCAFHQDVHARALYGDDLMNRYTRPKGPGCSEPVAAYGATDRTGDRVRDEPDQVPRQAGPRARHGGGLRGRGPGSRVRPRLRLRPASRTTGNASPTNHRPRAKDRLPLGLPAEAGRPRS